MYPNLNAEIARYGVSLSDLANAIGCKDSTMSMKLSGKSPINIDQAIAIKRYLNVDIPIEILFAKEVA